MSSKGFDPAVCLKGVIELNNLCATCDTCEKAKCCVYVAQNAIKYYNKKKQKIIPDGLSLVPSIDTKYFDEEDLDKTIEAIESICQHCGDYHEEDCFVSVARGNLQVLKHGEIMPFDPREED